MANRTRVEPGIFRVDLKSGTKYEAFAQRGGKSKRCGPRVDSLNAARMQRADFAARTRMIEAGELAEDYAERLTLRAAVDDWIGTLTAKKSRSLKPYRDGVTRSIDPLIAITSQNSPLVHVVKRGHIEALRIELAARYAPTTIEQTLSTWSAFFTFAIVDRGWVKTNPVAGIKRGRRDRGRYTWLTTQADIDRFLAGFKQRPRGHNHAHVAAFMVLTGLRIDEALHLRWDDVDFDRGLIAVHRGRKGPTKGGRIRYVPIMIDLKPLLRELWATRAGDLLFPGKFGRVRGTSALTTAIQRVADELKLELTSHGLRHTFASHWMLSGGCIFKLSKILGHRDVNMTARLYAHLSPDAFAGDLRRVRARVPGTHTIHTPPSGGTDNRPSLH